MTTALIEAATNRSLTHNEFKILASDFAARLGPQTVSQLVLIAARNRIDTIVALHGVWRAGHAALLVDAAISTEFLHRLITLYKPEKLVLPENFPFSSGENYKDEEKLHDLVILSRSPQSPALHPDLSLLLTTSGSTGSPKLVRLSRKNLEVNTAAIISTLGIIPQDRALAHMPLAYSFGLSVVNTHLAAGASLVLTEDSMVSGTFWNAVRDHNITTLPGVPYHFSMIGKLGLERLNIPLLRVMTQAGGRLEPRCIHSFATLMQKNGGRFFVMYGQTEAAPRMTILPAVRALDKPGSVGQPLKLGKITIEDGEVIYEGPNVMMGYAENRADLARGDDMNGRLATGDLGYLDEEGYLFLTGRKQHFAKIDGVRVNLDEIENMAGAVAPVVVLEHSEGLVLFTTGDTEAVRRHVTDRINIHPSRLKAYKVNAFPMLASGKIDREALRKFLT